MRTNVHYLHTTPEGRAKALADVREWLGAKRYADCTAMFKDMAATMSRLTFHAYAAMAGIQCFPVDVWADECGIAPYTEEELARMRG